MKKIIFLPLLLLFICASHPFPSVHAEERKMIANGKYQVELSFLSHEITGSDVLFGKQALLTVKEGRYTLSVPAKSDHILTKATAVQQGKKTNTWLDRAENLVQFDIKDVQQQVELTGTYRLAQENIHQPFSLKLAISKQSLPKFENVQSEPMIRQGNDTLHYELLKDGKPSAMIDYMNPVLRVVEKNHRLYVQMEILQPERVTGFIAEQHGKLEEPNVVTDAETRIIEFEVKDFPNKVRAQMRIKNPEKDYEHEEAVSIVFDQKQALKFMENERQAASDSTAISSLTRRTEQPAKIAVAAKKAPAAEKQDKVKETGNTEDTPPYVSPHEEQLAFDRMKDVKEKESDQPVAQTAGEPSVEPAVSTPNGQDVPFDLMKTGGLSLLCLLSGILLIRRLTKKNNGTTSE
ncbi:NEAT domain-containing protein [Sporosarcina sp. P33]|uniref:NEAT domain-containing protein n=1 Tax=Sporosarcina sp. P33 TaxID=1930764 RepID=UPI0009BE3B15|nr:NEAT domain-containing protein [Sporosarcina sp. P33]ARD48352.1 hypothetical protein SporoP33_08995 [Sporosarcina sp. P33]